MDMRNCVCQRRGCTERLGVQAAAARRMDMDGTTAVRGGGLDRCKPIISLFCDKHFPDGRVARRGPGTPRADQSGGVSAREAPLVPSSSWRPRMDESRREEVGDDDRVVSRSTIPGHAPPSTSGQHHHPYPVVSVTMSAHMGGARAAQWGPAPGRRVA